MICLTKDCQRIEAILRETLDILRDFKSGKKHWYEVEAAMNKGHLYLTKDDKFIDNRPGRDD